MSRKRVHEVARDLGIDPKDLVLKLEKLGIPGKRSQSSLEEHEIERIRMTVGGDDDKPTIVVGGERLVTSAEGQTVVERRVKTNVIRRRAAARSDAGPAALDVSIAAAPETPLVPESIESFESFATPDSFPDLPPASPVEPVALQEASEPEPVSTVSADLEAPPIVPPQGFIREIMKVKMLQMLELAARGGE